MQSIAYIVKYKQFALLLGGIFLLTFIVVLVNSKKSATSISSSLQQQPTAAPSGISETTLPAIADPQQRLIDKIQNRIPLSDSDMAAKKRILALLPSGKHSGLLYVSPSVSIEYVASANLFQIEILISNIDSAKEEAANWFRRYGFSNEGICNYPISFYLNFEVRNTLGEKANQLNPLPPGC